MDGSSICRNLKSYSAKNWLYPSSFLVLLPRQPLFRMTKSPFHQVETDPVFLDPLTSILYTKSLPSNNILLPNNEMRCDNMSFHLLSLPIDVLQSMTEFFHLGDFPFVVSSCKKLKGIVDDESVYHKFAQQRYPEHLLDVQMYDQSWKFLLRDDNVRNTIAAKVCQASTTVTVAKRLRTIHFEFVADVKVECLVWDRLNQKVGFIGKKYTLLPLGQCRFIRVGDVLREESTTQKAMSNEGKNRLIDILTSAMERDSTLSAEARAARIDALTSTKFAVFDVDESFFNDELIAKYGFSHLASLEENLIRFFSEGAPVTKSCVSKELLGMEPSRSEIEEQEESLTDMIISLVFTGLFALNQNP
ncbi:hypothetical protein IV203_003761 [Nitzschia inconspicua]|uniref:F-box domain-containing protein n=1 Tax=Nitzschia inconspicua TaxID=303405 RepID=A0A9K3L422_9STRA|nr:hypothetical protein IV203_003761 [Nitzschia inconspicua]